MSVDNVLLAIIIAGTGLAGADLSAKYLAWRRWKAAERRKQFRLRKLYANHPFTHEPHNQGNIQ
jgi:hypothetical protein